MNPRRSSPNSSRSDLSRSFFSSSSGFKVTSISFVSIVLPHFFSFRSMRGRVPARLRGPRRSGPASPRAIPARPSRPSRTCPARQGRRPFSTASTRKPAVQIDDVQRHAHEAHVYAAARQQQQPRAFRQAFAEHEARKAPAERRGDLDMPAHRALPQRREIIRTSPSCR